MSERLSLALVGLLALGCDTEFRAPLDLDTIADPHENCVTVIHESLEVGLALHDYVADAPSSTGGWALATILNEALNQPELAIVRIPARPDEPATAPIELGISDLASARVELRGGAVPGELWVLQESNAGSWLRKLAAGVGVIAGNPSLANFPAESSGGCPEQFHRQLLLIEGRPYLLAVPDCSDGTALDLQLLELHPDSLVFTSAWQLSFDPCLSDPECLLSPYKLEPIGGGESTHAAAATHVSIGLTQVREYITGITTAGVSLLDLRLHADVPDAKLISFREVWIAPNPLGFVHLAQDLFSVQLHVRNGGSEHDAALFRFDVISGNYMLVRSPHLPLGGRGRLVQLDTQSAIIDVDDGALVAVPLLEVETWPSWEPRRLLELDGLSSFESAGVGQLLLHREQAPAQIVRLHCLE